MALDPKAARLDGRVALVTGAAVGIGEAIALAFARFGADVAVCDRDAGGLADTVEAIRAEGRRARSAVLDLRDDAAVRDFVSRVAGEAGRIDVVVNNSGGSLRAPFLELSEKGQDALIRENFSSVASVVRAAARS